MYRQIQEDREHQQRQGRRPCQELLVVLGVPVDRPGRQLVEVGTRYLSRIRNYPVLQELLAARAGKAKIRPILLEPVQVLLEMDL